MANRKNIILFGLVIFGSCILKNHATEVINFDPDLQMTSNLYLSIWQIGKISFFLGWIYLVPVYYKLLLILLQNTNKHAHAQIKKVIYISLKKSHWTACCLAIISLPTGTVSYVCAKLCLLCLSCVYKTKCMLLTYFIRKCANFVKVILQDYNQTHITHYYFRV